MDNKTIKIINHYTNVIRDTMNNIIEEINGDFTDWCELGSMLMFRVIEDKFPNLENKVALGTFKGNGHFWNIIDGIIVDTTIDQFGKFKVGVINDKWHSDYKIKNIIDFNREDLKMMTEEVYDFLYLI